MKLNTFPSRATIVMLVVLMLAFLACTPVAKASEFVEAATPIPITEVNYDDYFKKLIINSIEKTGHVLDKAVDFVVEEAPKVVEEFLMWKFIESFLGFCLSIGLTICTLIGGFFIYRNRYDVKEGLAGTNLSASIIATVILVMLAMVSFNKTMNLDWLKIKMAPRIYLIEYASSVYKGVKK